MICCRTMCAWDGGLPSEGPFEHLSDPTISLNSSYSHLSIPRTSVHFEHFSLSLSLFFTFFHSLTLTTSTLHYQHQLFQINKIPLFLVFPTDRAIMGTTLDVPLHSVIVRHILNSIHTHVQQMNDTF